MSQSGEGRRRWSFLQREIGENWPIFTGDFECLNELLAEKPTKSAWVLLQFCNAICRSFGQVILANNPISGLIIIFAIGIANYQALLAGLLTATISFALAFLFQQNASAIFNGIYGFNPVLHGVVSLGALPSIYPDIDVAQPKFWLFLIVTTLLSVYVTAAINNLFIYIGRYPIPAFSLPFNILQFMLIFCLLNNSMPSKILSNHLLEVREKYNISDTNVTSDLNTIAEIAFFDNVTEVNSEGSNRLNWGATFSGTVVAVAQVYGLNNIISATMMYLALFVYSPIMTGFAYLGSLLGTLLGIMFASTPVELYNGVWGYNTLLCAAALGGFTFALNFQSAMIAMTSIVFSTVLQHFLNPLFIALNCPILSMPFNVTTILFLFVTTDRDDGLSRPETITFPEQHRHQYRAMFSNQPQQGYLRRVRMSEDKEEI